MNNNIQPSDELNYLSENVYKKVKERFEKDEKFENFKDYFDFHLIDIS